MRLLLSPYHLTTREPAAMAALLVADSVCTWLPVPGTGVQRSDVAAAICACPRYARLLESWWWSAPLWNAGIVGSLVRNEDAGADVAAASRRIEQEPEWRRLRGFMHPDLFGPKGPASAGQGLDAISADLLKGGPDPGISLPVVAGLDTFASRHGLTVVRASGPSPARLRSRAAPAGGVPALSAAQRAEERLGETLFAVALPVLTQAGAGTILAARRALREPLATLRTAFDSFSSENPVGERVLRGAGEAYGREFDRLIAPRVGLDDDEGRQVLRGFVRAIGRRVPRNASLLSALAAMRQLGGSHGRATVGTMGLAEGANRKGRVAHGVDAAMLMTLVVELMSVAPAVASAGDARRNGAAP